MKNLFTKTLLSVAAITALTTSLSASSIIEIGDGSVSDEMTTVTLFDGTKYVLTGFTVGAGAGIEYGKAVAKLNYKEDLPWGNWITKDFAYSTGLEFEINTELNTNLGLTTNLHIPTAKDNNLLTTFITVGVESYYTETINNSEVVNYNEIGDVISSNSISENGDLKRSISPYGKLGLNIFESKNLDISSYGYLNKDYAGAGADVRILIEKDISLTLQAKALTSKNYQDQTNFTVGFSKSF